VKKEIFSMLKLPIPLQRRNNTSRAVIVPGTIVPGTTIGTVVPGKSPPSPSAIIRELYVSYMLLFYLQCAAGFQ